MRSIFITLFMYILETYGVPVVLEGSQSSYAQFEKWRAGLNDSLFLDFSTYQPNGLILYTDDGGNFDFFELKLVDGSLRLRFNLGGGAQMMTVGRGLNDNQWHKVEIRRQIESTMLKVDYISATRSSPGMDWTFGNPSDNSYVYIGGIPSWYNSKLTHLALPSVNFEPRFKGSIRNLIYADLSGPDRMQRVVGHKGFRFDEKDACEQNDPCRHGGVCISTDDGAKCECRGIDYDGAFCEMEKPPAEATFRGSQWLSYDLTKMGGEPIVSMQDEVSLYFKTSSPSGLLLFSGDGEDYLNLAIKDGGVILRVNLGSGPMDITVKPNRVRFDDDEWHKVVVNRKVVEITESTSFCHLSITVDGLYTEKGSTAGGFTSLSSKRLYVGGSENTAALPGTRTRDNFVGCLKKVSFRADTITLDVLELGQIKSKLITVSGNVIFMCQATEASEPINFINKDSYMAAYETGEITFTTTQSYLALSHWDSPNAGSLTFKIRTKEPNGLLMYNGGGSPNEDDFFAFEMLDGYVYLHMNLGSGTIKVKPSSRRIHDGLWHQIFLSRNQRSGKVSVDDVGEDFIIPGDKNMLDLGGNLYVGGVGTALDMISVPTEVWTGKLRYGYVGCMKDFVMNGNVIDLASYVRRQDSGSIKTVCNTTPPQCESRPCLHGGHCVEGWNRYVCDCSEVGFVGPRCGKEATTFSFDGSQYISMTFPEESKTQAEDWTLRFKTSRPSGLLLATRSTQSSSLFKLDVTMGSVRMQIVIGKKDQALFSGRELHDNQWHTVKVRRRGQEIELVVDQEQPKLSHVDVPVSQAILHFNMVHVGAIVELEEELRLTVFEDHNFIGQMQQLIFNGHYLFELAHAGSTMQTDITAKVVKKEQLVHHPITFKSRHTFIGLSQLKVYSQTNIYFQFKTIEPNGLIMFNDGRGQDFFAIELINGHIHFKFNLGDGPLRVKDSSKTELNDNKWHSVSITRPSLKQHNLIVDDNISTVTSMGTNENLDLQGNLFIGGVRKHMYEHLPKPIESKHGYEGCLASLDLNGESPSLITDASNVSPAVVEGCEGPSTKCTSTACSNGGRCVQKWNTYTCNCDMTTFSGPNCRDESISYDFGPNGGVITFTHPHDKMPDTKGDFIAVGFITHRYNGMLVRITSCGSNDFMELKIVNSHIEMTYDMGIHRHVIEDDKIRVDDGHYHIVKFTRAGANSTLQVDNGNIYYRQPPGKQLTVFNSQCQVQIGGRYNITESLSVRNPFEGIMSGLVLNGIKILDLSAHRNPRIRIHGDVKLLKALPRNQFGQRPNPLNTMLRTPPDESVDTDDLIYSGAGSGCEEDDEDQCVPVVDPGSVGDDLITPVYIPPTAKPTYRPTSTSTTHVKICDDEDCVPGSGSGEIVTTEEEAWNTFSGRGTPSSTSTTQFGGTITYTNRSEWDNRETTQQFRPTSKDTSTSQSSSSSSSSSSSPSGGSTHDREPDSPGGRYWDTFDADRDYNPSDTSTSSTTHSATNLTPRIKWGDTNVRYPRPRSSTTRPFPIEPVWPEQTRDPKDKERDDYRIRSEAAENTALVIGIIAGALIAIILIILLILRFRGRSETNYKIDDGKNYQYVPPVAPAGGSMVTMGGFHNNSQNGAMRPVEPMVRKGNGAKDVKEWYV